MGINAGGLASGDKGRGPGRGEAEAGVGGGGDEELQAGDVDFVGFGKVDRDGRRGGPELIEELGGGAEGELGGGREERMVHGFLSLAIWMSAGAI
jgi:hypothetical protein